MKKNRIFKYILLATIGLTVLASCSKEEELEPEETQSGLRKVVLKESLTVEFEKTEFGHTLKYETEEFIDGGVHCISGIGVWAPCVVIGDQRWVTMDINASLPSGVGDGRSVLHPETGVYNPMYDREAAEWIGNTAGTTIMGYGGPAITQLSGFRMPTEDDAEHLYGMAGGNDAAIIAALQLTKTGLLGDIGGTPMFFNGHLGYFWVEETFNPDRNWLFAADIDNSHVYLTEHQYPYYVPVRLVQTISQP
jgi:hypothetical protein